MRGTSKVKHVTEDRNRLTENGDTIVIWISNLSFAVYTEIILTHLTYAYMFNYNFHIQ